MKLYKASESKVWWAIWVLFYISIWSGIVFVMLRYILMDKALAWAGTFNAFVLVGIAYWILCVALLWSGFYVISKIIPPLKRDK